ncbi:MAG: DUF2786 domain-containing protein [Bacteriovoracaceae bacterium]|nr:DUF2786 domain-containing protein [Bacteriovoracaceae bacterium]
MRVYSKSIESFLKVLHLYTKQILKEEFLVRVGRTRFHLDSGWSYPISIVAIEDNKQLGYFDHTTCVIGINRCLMYKAKVAVIKNILRHELAHYFTYINYQGYSDLLPHGKEFRQVCTQNGLGVDVACAVADIKKENDLLEGDLKSEKVIEKIKKLLTLASSENQNEAQLATLKANQLMLQHNLDTMSLSHCDEHDIEYFVKLILKCKRYTPKISAITQILSEFFVFPVKTSQGVEVTGTRANIDNAEYIAKFLDYELSKIWKTVKSKNPALKQKPFMVALSHSYKQKLKQAKRKIPCADQNALVAIDKNISWAAQGLYGGLYNSYTSSYQHCHKSALQGQKAGENLCINRAVSSSETVTLLDY